jgi:hypothetical protein
VSSPVSDGDAGQVVADDSSTGVDEDVCRPPLTRVDGPARLGSGSGDPVPVKMMSIGVVSPFVRGASDFSKSGKMRWSPPGLLRPRLEPNK